MSFAKKGAGFMKIGRNEIDRVYNNPVMSENNSGERKSKTEASVSQDKVIISNKAKEFSPVKNSIEIVIKEVKKPTSSEKLLRLRDEIAADKYIVSSDAIAEAIIRGTKPK
ncbi:MAG: hypothetical protein A2Y17_04285 [Clostridiales bacterium GWF2_38_85]|nr:MAG: hypothetical protein A2Y17_04285 [Clostridiales bacterium GWF2_38_85]HBL83430.1 hypothetical protein [Clostridiales bacterium]